MFSYIYMKTIWKKFFSGVTFSYILNWPIRKKIMLICWIASTILGEEILLIPCISVVFYTFNVVFYTMVSLLYEKSRNILCYSKRQMHIQWACVCHGYWGAGFRVHEKKWSGIIKRAVICFHLYNIWFKVAGMQILNSTWI